MKILITGICGFVGYRLAMALVETDGISQVSGVDNLCRDGSRHHLEPLRRAGIEVAVADIRDPATFAQLTGDCDWVIDAAAQPSVLAGVDGKTSSRELVEHNLYGTINILEFCKDRGAGFILLSTSRVYSLNDLTAVGVTVRGASYEPVLPGPTGFSGEGLSEDFSTDPPLSLYGATKRASELMALEYGGIYGFPVRINRCGVLAGAHQFGHPTQGIFSFWLHSWMHGRPLRYIGFDGAGHQVRDCLHPLDLLPVLVKQMEQPEASFPRVLNFSGGRSNAASLAELSAWCTSRWGERAVASQQEERPFDAPWIVLDSSRAAKHWGFTVTRNLESILVEIAEFAESNPQWLDWSLGAG